MTDEYVDGENAEHYDPSSTEDDNLLTVDGVAQLLGVSRTTVHNWRSKGLLKAYRVGFTRKVRYKRDEVLAAASEANNLTRI